MKRSPTANMTPFEKVRLWVGIAVLVAKYEDEGRLNAMLELIQKEIGRIEREARAAEEPKP